MTAQLIQDVDGIYIKSEFALDSLISAMEVRGYSLCGISKARGQRAELVGQPEFKGVAGPMWGGPGVLRYETTKVYAEASQ